MVRRNLMALILSAGILAVLGAVVAVPVFFFRSPSHAAQAGVFFRAATINQLKHISVVGSTEFIVDGHGRTIDVDPNPYGVMILPTSQFLNRTNTLRAGDILVTNIGANDTGVTLVRFPNKMGPGHLFNMTPNANTKGPSAMAYNSMTGSIWVANTTANDIQVFRPDGTVLVTVKSPLFRKPWGQAFNQGVRNRANGAVSSFFSTNVMDGSIDRIDLIPMANGVTFRVTQIAQLGVAGQENKVPVLWVPSLIVNGKRFNDVLLAGDPVRNRIAFFPNSTSMKSSPTSRGLTAFMGKPLNVPAGFTFNPLNGDLLVTNLNDNNLSELNLAQGRAVATHLLDNVPVDLQSGNGSALFGVAASKDANGNLAVFFTDDNTNTLDMLSL